ncbi:uncharacterized protein PFL1_06777 [Pseudozyma flocculosa PF-1]|uniref:DinB-like domain-containing protein n=2 Tax=Pseudozyma flocculosa TaxID=84751 RepID=A0A5C3FD10_9BASI|nr:uncharacterized protein PFL1_06777 [Pseudozyma flocculosa PF-1]EPQ25640.1 hypothetical protein PFL1_06777 [Pseudozyma flocculosa PF-1]SPO42046.1 uncharacterized protein PSFLO_07529 [Pseudozyma flocculosa]
MPDAASGLVSSSLQILHQPISILQARQVSQQTLQYESEIVTGSTPGKHLRHVHDHFRILAESLENHVSTPHTPQSSRDTPIELDYDLRSSRRLPSLETSTSTCLDEFKDVHARLSNLLTAHPTLLAHPVNLCATTPDIVETRTTVGRELWFCALHAIHHYALARVILEKECGCTLDPEFGVAPSTLVHREWKRDENRADVAVDVVRQRARL